jgi:23S rRNA (uracil1939-C5)-methyltransferase
MSAVTLSISAMGAKGDGIALHEGARLPVAFALPGERISARIEGGRGEVIEVLEASPERALPGCGYFGTCGGCALQHWTPEAVLGWKRERVIEAIRRVGLDAPVTGTLDAHGAGRRRVTLHVRYGAQGAPAEAGFMRARSHELIDLEACPLLVPELAPAPDLARSIGHVLRGLAKPLDVQATATLDGLDIDIRGAGTLPEALRLKLIAFAAETGLARLTLHGTRLLEARVPRIRTEDEPAILMFLPPGSFLQATARAEAVLGALAREALTGTKALAELFCGLGPFGLRLSRGMKVTAFDSDKSAIEAFQRSIRANPGGKPIVAEARDLFRRPLYTPELKPFDAVLLDPPRQGAEAQVREIAKSKIGRVAYVSCDPESFARDARILADAGFRLEGVTPVDQFRHSAHVELVAKLSR